MAFPTLATETKCSGGVPGVTAPHLHCVPLHPLCAGEVQAFYEDLSGRQYVNEVFNFSVDKLYDLLFTDSPFQRDFMEQRRFSGPPPLLPDGPSHPFPLCPHLFPSFSWPPDGSGHPLSGSGSARAPGGPASSSSPRTTAVGSPLAPSGQAPQAPHLVQSSSCHFLVQLAIHQAPFTVSFNPPVCPVCKCRDPLIAVRTLELRSFFFFPAF